MDRKCIGYISLQCLKIVDTIQSNSVSPGKCFLSSENQLLWLVTDQCEQNFISVREECLLLTHGAEALH